MATVAVIHRVDFARAGLSTQLAGAGFEVLDTADHWTADVVLTDRPVDHHCQVLIGSRLSEAGLIRLLGGGVQAIVHADCAPATLEMAVREAARGALFLDPEFAALILGYWRVRVRSAEAELTPQQLRVLQVLADDPGTKNREIARLLGVSVHTVKTHMHKAFRRLEVDNRHDAVAEARRRGITRTVQPSDTWPGADDRGLTRTAASDPDKDHG